MKAKKNILYLHASAELYGSDITLLQLVTNINKEEFIPHVILPCDGPLVQKLKDENINVSIIEYPIIRRKEFTPIGIIRYIFNYIKTSNIIKKYCLNNNIDVIHINTLAVLEGIYLRKKLKKPLVWHVHEIIKSPKIISKFLSYCVSKNSDKVVAVSNAVKEHLIASGYFKNKSIDVIYNGIDNSIFNPNNDYQYLLQELDIPKNSIVVGMVGRINAWKGQTDFLVAIDKILKKYDNVYALIIGSAYTGQEWRVEELKKTISINENKDRIKLLDFRNDVKNFYCLFDVFVLPSILPEPFGLVVAEAMASATPVVAYNHGGASEIIEDGKDGFLVDPCNTGALFKSIDDLISSPEKMKQMGEIAIEHQKKCFSISSYVSNFEILYEKVIHNDNGFV